MRWHLRSMRYKIRHTIRWPKYAYQRVTRGFSDRDMWNADRYLARIYADILMWYVHKGMGVSVAYADDWNTPIEIMEERRNVDYYKYADIFRRYAKEGVWDTQEHVDKWGGVLDSEIDEALEWFGKHFQGLWD